MRANETQRNDEGTEQPCYPAMREALEEHFTDRKGAISSQGIGYFLRQHAGRILMGARFERSGTVQHREQWRVVIADKKRFESEAEKNTRPTGASSPFSPSSPPPPHPHRDQSGATTKNQRDTSFSTGQAPREDGFHGEDGEDGEDVSPSPEISPEKISVDKVRWGNFLGEGELTPQTPTTPHRRRIIERIPGSQGSWGSQFPLARKFPQKKLAFPRLVAHRRPPPATPRYRRLQAAMRANSGTF